MRLDAIRQDIHYALRGLRRSPAFTLAVVLTLALGIGANAAMFGVVDRLLFRAPAFLQAPDRVHRVYLLRSFRGEENAAGWFQYTRYTDLTRWSASFDVTAAMSEPELAVGVGDAAAELQIGVVSATYWALFDVKPELGRLFTPAEDVTPQGALVTVLSHGFWQSRYGGRADVLGERLKIAKLDYTIVGVLPAGFAGTSAERAPVAWIPLTTYAGTEFAGNPRDPHNWFTKYNISWIQMLARRKPGVSVTAASADLSTAFRRSYLAQRELSPGTTPIEIAKPRALAAPLLVARGPQATAVSKVARWVSGVALVVLLIAAANVANLLLARALRRRREVAVRLALGVSRGRLLSQLLTESLLLAGLGAAAGLLLAQWGGAVLRSQFLPAGSDIPVLGDGRTLGFAALAMLLVGLLTGLAPALQSGRGDLTSALKSGTREGTYHRSRTRTVLLVLQGALSVLLLVGAGLFVRSMRNVRSLELGYDVEPLLWVSVEERDQKLSADERESLRRRLLETAQALPQVASASRARTVPFWMTWNEDVYVAGIDSTNRLGSFNIQAATPEYLATMGTRLLRGRFLAATDLRDAPKVTVVSQAMAEALWPGRDPIGQCVRLGADTAPCTTVVGLAENVRTQSMSEDKLLYYYLPMDQVRNPGEGGLFVRTRGPAAAQAEAVRSALQRLMPGASYVTVHPMSEIFDPMIRSWRLGATLFVAFGGLALVLAAVGLYSVIAYNVTQRMHELGVRVAFGARASDLVRLVLREGLLLTLAGVAIGMAAALFAGRWMAPLLFEVKPTEPAVFGFVAIVLLVVAACASLLPALRAARVDPNLALRAE